MKSEILFQGNFTEENIACKYHPISSRRIDTEIENKAKLIWERKVAEAEAKGKKIWDQPVYRLERFEITGNTCSLDFSTIPFSIRSSIKDFIDYLNEKGEDYLPMACYSSIFVETSDGFFIFGEKSDKYVANRKYSYIGGVFNKSDDPNAPVNLFESAVSEIIEELGVNKEEIEKFRLLGALSSDSGNVCFVFHGRLKLSKTETDERFLKKNDQELNRLFYITKESLRDFGINTVGKESQIVDILEQNFQ